MQVRKEERRAAGPITTPEAAATSRPGAGIQQVLMLQRTSGNAALARFFEGEATPLPAIQQNAPAPEPRPKIQEGEEAETIDAQQRAALLPQLGQGRSFARSGITLLHGAASGVDDVARALDTEGASNILAEFRARTLSDLKSAGGFFEIGADLREGAELAFGGGAVPDETQALDAAMRRAQFATTDRWTPMVRDLASGQDDVVSLLKSEMAFVEGQVKAALDASAPFEQAA